MTAATRPAERTDLASAALDVDQSALADAVRHRRPFRLHHRLAGHPLLCADEIERVIGRVPASQVDHHLGNLPLLLPRGDAPALDQSPAEVVRGIDRNGCWVRVGSLGNVPGWDGLLDQCLAGVAGTSGRYAQVFLASPHAVTPAHFDAYHNVLLQVQGTKELSIGRFTDRALARREFARRFEQQENARALPTEVTTFRLAPGDGLYIPPYTFHWAQVGDDVSLSLSCNFSNDWNERARLVEAWNRRLRRAGLEPDPPGVAELRDQMKAVMVRTWRAARARLS